MKVVFLSDVHGNFPALRAALELAERLGAERVIAAGDLVGEGPFPVEVVRELVERGIPCVRGNVDRKVLKLGTKRKRLHKRLERKNRRERNRAWTALQLREAEAERDWLEALPEELPLELEGHEVLVVHGSPLGDTDYIYPSLTPEALRTKLEPLGGRRPALLVCGHSHLPFAREVDGVWVVNCGSVGRPKDGDPRGALAVVDLDASGIRAEIVRFPYPVEEVMAAVRERDVAGIDPEDYPRGVK